MDELILVTPTSDRPEAFALCEEMMREQTHSALHHWVVVDGGQEPVKTNLFQIYHRRTPEENETPAQNFQRNVNKALKMAVSLSAYGRSEKVVIIEDDAFYKSDYLEWISSKLDKFNIVGEGRCRDYDVRNGRYRVCQNRKHASLCQTAINACVLMPFLHEVFPSQPKPDLDTVLWSMFDDKPHLRYLAPESEHSVNIKGMPGKTGLIGHDMGEKWPVDEDGSVLRRWVGEEAAEIYWKYRERS